MTFQIGQKVWVVNPPVTADGVHCISNWTPREGRIVRINSPPSVNQDFLIDTGESREHSPRKAMYATPGREQWWYYKKDIDVFMTCCMEAVDDQTRMP